MDEVWVIQITSVCPEYTRRGLANAMTERVLVVAKELGFTIVMSESSSTYTQRNKIKNFQFEKIMESSFADNYASYSEMPEEIKKSHNASAVLIKKL